ncbi:MAG: hypothetical protein ACI4TK_20325 [Agathobacter sp.]
MPRNQAQRMFFALITVIITVHAFVFFSLYVVNGSKLMEITGTATVMEALRLQGGVYMFGRIMPVWSVILVEFCLAYFLENIMGSPGSFKLALRVFDPRETHPVLFETAIISATVGLMCPSMSLIAAFLYYPYYTGFSMVTLIAMWLRLVCFNFPFALLSQMFFIQPFVRTVFKTVFRKDLKRREEKARKLEEEKKMPAPAEKIDSYADIIGYVESIRDQLRVELQDELKELNLK